MYVIILSDEDLVVRAYGPYKYEDEADAAFEKIKTLFPVERDGLYLEKAELIPLDGYAG